MQVEHDGRNQTSNLANLANTEAAGTGSDRSEALRGLSYDEQMAALAPGGAPTNDAVNKVGPTSDVTVGKLYSNTSVSNLADHTDARRHGITETSEYTMSLTFDDLVRAGQHCKLPTPTGRQEKTITSKNKDYIRPDRANSVEENGTTNFELLGGDYTPGTPNTSLSLVVANNGALNLGRLARAAFNLATGHGATISGRKVSHNGKKYKLNCTMTMGNAIKSRGARDHGFEGETPLDWFREKTSETIDLMIGCIMVSKQLTGQGEEDGLHAENKLAKTFQTSRDNSQTRPVESAYKLQNTYWLTRNPAIVAAAADRIRYLWMPVGHTPRDTYIKDIPGFTDIEQDLTTMLDELTATGKSNPDKWGPTIKATADNFLQEILEGAENHTELVLIKDPERVKEVRNKNITSITDAFSAIGTEIDDKIGNKMRANKGSVKARGNTPVKGETPSYEGLIQP